ncbi:hypothetical protein N7492_006786 [Penicillium capsulatum]|uniref:DH domain-containing protein n=1 Tax=Penicillium capsulatum TaxID=69766 RepID=A0A9W9HZZ6_9EURO|nr:hypothetical protein N7492_006786 [Penicillium capsulatum]KAJ6116622.1 hypothetical protein N7512_006347 [Penicillium capsulatum]
MDSQDEIETERPLLYCEEDKKDLDPENESEATPTAMPAHPFKKWMDSFRVRKRVPPTIPERYVEGWSDSSQSDLLVRTPTLRRESPREQLQWERSSGHSSQLGTVKTTTVSITSQSMARSRGTTQSTANQSTVSDVRISAESARPTSSNYVDEAAEIRASKRRQVLREIVTTEADYVLGLKALTGVLSIFNTRPQIYHNLQQIREIHERFLAQLHITTPHSASHVPEGAQDLVSRGLSKRLGAIDLSGLKGLQNRSLRTRNFKATIQQRLKAMAADPLEGLEVAREIDKLSVSFFAYEEFCNNYEMLTHDVAILRRSILNWAVFDQGIEALSKSVASVESRRHEENKSMTMNDLMIKPIQRLCKYPLLLQDLLRNTPVSDCPTSHDGIRQVVEGLRVLVARINSATGNPVNKDRIQKTIILQNKIVFPDTCALQDIYQELGPVILCGVLHVTYQAPEQHTTGEFMVSALFGCYFLLARSTEDFRRLEVVACIYIDDLKMDAVQNGRGLHCYGCSFSWKLLFQIDEENYEVVLSASSAIEEKHWKTEILKCTAALAETAKPGGSWDPRQYCVLSLDLVPLDRIQYSMSSLGRRTSMDSMAVSRKNNAQHVVIKKTHFPHTIGESVTLTDGEIDRPRTPAMRGVLTVTARRIDRIRLERQVTDVYTRDVLPLPGMALGRGDLFRRGSIMRRLSFHAGFTRRSTSVSTTHSGPMVTDSRSVGEYDGEEKELAGSMDGGNDQHSALEADCESPKTPTSMDGHSRIVRFRSASRKTTGSVSSPRSEKRPSQDSSHEWSPTRKKWTSPLTLLNVFHRRT